MVVFIPPKTFLILRSMYSNCHHKGVGLHAISHYLSQLGEAESIMNCRFLVLFVTQCIAKYVQFYVQHWSPPLRKDVKAAQRRFTALIRRRGRLS